MTDKTFEFTGDRLKLSRHDYLFAQCFGNGFGAWIGYYQAVGRMPPITLEALADLSWQAAEAGVRRSEQA